MANMRGYNPAPGPQEPNKYPFVGPNYKRYGEQPGFFYDPYKDQYFPNPKTRQELLEKQGVVDKPPSPPGLAEQLVPIGAAAGALYVGKGIGEGVPGFFTEPGRMGTKAVDGLKNAATGMFDIDIAGLKGPAAGTSGTSPTVASNVPATPEVVGASQDIAGMLTPAPTSIVVSQGQAIPQGYTGVQMTADGGTIAVPSESITPDGGVGGVNVGNLVQGAAGGAQLYQGYKDFKEGDYLGAGINTVGGATLVGSALGNETAAAALPYVGPVVGAWGLKNMADFVGSAPSGGRRNSGAAIQGAASGAAIGSAIPGVGTVAGAFIGGLTGLASSLFGSSKSGDQMIRDQGRKVLQEGGLLDENWQGSLADGSKFDFGKDGKGLGKIKYDDPVTSRVIGLANVLASGEGAFGRSTQAMAHLYTGAALSNSGGDYEKARQNMLHFAKQRGFTPQNVSQQLGKMKEEGQIDDAQYQAYLGGLNELFRGAGNAPAPMAPPPPPAPAPAAPAAQPPSDAPTGMLEPEQQPQQSKRRTPPRNRAGITGMFG